MLQTTGDLICSRRAALHLTQAQLAEIIHVSPKAVSKWEKGVSRS